MKSLPVALSIAGSDNSAGAGIQADLKAMSALRVYGVTAVTCVVAEIPGKVTRIQPVEQDVVAEQIRLLLEGFPVSAIKTGMLHSVGILRVVCEQLRALRERGGNAPLVVDPVMVATSGDRLLQQDALEAYQTQLLPLADLVTPNLDEAAVLWGRSVNGIEEMRAAGQFLRDRYQTAFLMKGGHLRGKVAVDLLVDKDGVETWFEAPYIEGVSTHGTGCTYSAAIVAMLARGADLAAAIGLAKRYVSAAIAGHLRWGEYVGAPSLPVDALDHFASPEGWKDVGTAE
jgi:hydroxymethylpyrimidine/phosphomethylpyrimidine kinase